MSESKRACKQCQYFDPNTSIVGKGMCRINPPNLHHGSSNGSWPMIHDGAWCGQFKQREQIPEVDHDQ